MKLDTNYLKENYLILSIKLLLLCLFITSLFKGITNIMHHYNTAYEHKQNTIENYYYIARYYTYLKPSILLIFPITGVFINNKIGWILVQSYFYFLITNFVFFIQPTDSKIPVVIIIVGLLVLIALMNSNKISHLNYRISKSKLAGNNSIAFITGIAITVLVTIIKVNGI